MAFDGSGTFIRLRSWIADAVAGVKIRADFHDDEDNNFADGLSHCITKDGQTTITQNIPFNSKRIISLQDPIDPQDAATKAYADTKMPLDGSVPITGDVIVRNDDPSITLDGKDGFKNSIFGDKGGKHRWEVVLGNATAETGSNAGSDFQLIPYADDGTTTLGNAFFGTRSTGLVTVKADPTVALGIATKQYTDAQVATRLPTTGGTITGNLTVAGTGQVNGELIAVQNYIRFGYSASPGYLIWQGGANYALGGAGTIWHSGNFNPNAIPGGVTQDVRLAFAGEVAVAFGGPSGPMIESYPGAAIVGYTWTIAGGVAVTGAYRFRYTQVLKNGTWFTVGVV